ncbi:FtsX-like permease family protein [Flammeovirgaceae bacterium SG7u.111]|nr:FtsX-like permease family protein [Flammeovirgaceae bacterium SG7u.132]WPO33931.1 FtsX-like permease family protein [Flammeovirgaceae bacterium SG7u.111]
MDRVIKINRQKKSWIKSLWVWKLAWKDARSKLPRILVFISSIGIGIAAFVSVNSFNNNLKKDIDNQAKALLAADLVLYNDKDFQTADELYFDTIPTEQASDLRFSSYVQFPFLEDGRLVQIVAIKGGYPFYGEMKTLPKNALEQFRNQEGILLDDNLALQYEVSTGDTLQIGKLIFPVAGVVTKLPGNIKIMGTIAPSIYIPYDTVQQTGLIDKGSRLYYRKFFKIGSERKTAAFLEEIKPIINKYGFGYETVTFRKESLGNGFENLYRFLNLAGFIALIIGSVGVGASVNVYVREKIKTVAILRCLGASGKDVFNLFLIQVVFMGLIGSITGAALGSALQSLLPFIFQDFLPAALTFKTSWPSVLFGVCVGVSVTVLFSILPLLKTRYTPPLSVLREEAIDLGHKPSSIFWIACLVLLVNWAFTIYLTKDILTGSLFFISFSGAILSLVTVGVLAVTLTKKLFPSKASFVWKQGFSNLFRPQNQTVLLMVVIGMGALLISIVTIIHTGILNQVADVWSENRTNLVLYDIQPDQKEEVLECAERLGLDIEDIIPVVSLRIHEINGKDLNAIKADSVGGQIPNWVLYMEHPVTYRDDLMDAETLVKGEIKVLEDGSKPDTVPVSISEVLSQQLKLDTGDYIQFKLHGIQLNARVCSVRKVRWQRIPANFGFVFPKGVLEEAPQFYAALLHAPSQQASVRLKQELSEKHANISAIDLDLIMQTLDDLLSRLAFVIRFMSVFSILTGLLVLYTSIVNSKYIRLREVSLLRTLGAFQSQIVKITIIEYFFIGGLAALSGILLSLIATWGLGKYFLEINLRPSFYSLSLVFVLITALTIVVSWLNIRPIMQRPPIESLQNKQ